VDFVNRGIFSGFLLYFIGICRILCETAAANDGAPCRFVGPRQTRSYALRHGHPLLIHQKGPGILQWNRICCSAPRAMRRRMHANALLRDVAFGHS